MSDATVVSLAGDGLGGWKDGKGTLAQFHDPSSVAYSPDGEKLFVSETVNNFLRLVDVASGNVTTVAGTGQSGRADGPSMAASFRGIVHVKGSSVSSLLAMADLDISSRLSSVRLMMRSFCGDSRTEVIPPPLHST